MNFLENKGFKVVITASPDKKEIQKINKRI